MPIYEYICQSCHHRFDVKQGMKDPPILACVKCGQAVTKIISASAIMFKGSGWYVTDYSDKLKPPAETKPEPDSKPAETQKSETPAASPAESNTPAKTPAGEPSGTTSSSGSGTSTPPATPAPSTSSSS